MLQIYVISSRPSYQLFVTFLPEKQRLSPAKNFNSPSVCYEKKSLRRSALQTQISVNFLSEGVRQVLFTDGEKCNLVTFQDVWWVRI